LTGKFFSGDYLELLTGGLDPAVKAIACLNPLGKKFRMSGDLLVEILLQNRANFGLLATFGDA
jgi:hypothetical protein